MADDMEYALSCVICMELYKEPMLLPCAHSLCKACFERLRRPTDKPVAKTIDCPQCRKKIDLGDNCKNVKKNFQLASIVDIYIQDSSRRQHLDNESPRPQRHQHISPQPQAQPQVVKPKGFLAQLRQKQTQRQQQKAKKIQSVTNSPRASQEAQPALVDAIANLRSSLRRTSQEFADKSPEEEDIPGDRPIPRRPAPPPPLSTIPSSSAQPTQPTDQQLQEPKVPPPVPRRNYKLEGVYENIGSLRRRPPPDPPESNPDGEQNSQSEQQQTQTSPDIAPEALSSPTPSTEETVSGLPATSQPANQEVSSEPSTEVKTPTTEEPEQNGIEVFNIIGASLSNSEDSSQNGPQEIQNQLTPTCSTCDKDPPNPATVHCSTCSFIFCGSCLGAFHPDPNVAHHDIKPIKEIEPDAKCVLCEKEKWTQFCMECGMLFCRGCQPGHHPNELNHWMHETPFQRSMSLRGTPERQTSSAEAKSPIHRHASVPAGMGSQSLEAATVSEEFQEKNCSCNKVAFLRCLDCETNLCKPCAHSKHQSKSMETHTFVRVTEDDVEKLIQKGLLELMVLKQDLMGELSTKVNED